MKAQQRSVSRSEALEHALLILAPVATVVLLYRYISTHNVAVDFKQEYWVAGFRVLHGGNPYAWSAQQIAGGVSFPYPPSAALLFAPFALVDRGVSEGVFIAVSFAALAGTLRLLSVRDWRVYAIAFLWWPVINAWQVASVTLVLMLLIVFAWRYRSSPLVAGAAVALAIALKPFVWPILVWLIATRRLRAAAYALTLTVLANALALIVLGSSALSDFTTLAKHVTDALYWTGYGLIAITVHAGGSRTAGWVVLAVLSTAIAVACLRAGLAGRDQTALTLAIALMLAASPLVWNHYFALLIVPLAIARPRLSVAWVVPLVLWVCPAEHVAGWQAALAAIVTIGLIEGLIRESGADVAEAPGRPPRLATVGRAR